MISIEISARMLRAVVGSSFILAGIILAVLALWLKPKLCDRWFRGFALLGYLWFIMKSALKEEILDLLFIDKVFIMESCLQFLFQKGLPKKI
ncbi:hypothetical protein A3I27_02850 [Candidatus Giovannonibacteria bacterium RIFCSPLOWO2_02_FULL_43_11b]|uniref:Uncharacterized protein n=1 Tax=Candidatus Giovannonibacteria bacterium RIFCSPHIGHO2_12_FULL_43_15 TaxID=1798341 RepID=A0A1F5WR33_9BACT|nr:MAG: hypothetical protein A2739_00085 [Candidatus Giovannonibacteria bacterium RIFCSPHIGHO2_01_FULL_43_100]OGF66100.1 MAG: hypothetical protein A3B97_01185 [Candidatus Giovannonibacteria bacterium RIFCSPHIGHO2_02_FULL_43_32]OGF78080.1 MAG: hypothetical protein A3F23_02660 [Candidatus Giovannonibacteria bacterium RIFCSPHIGHO2_12_FULL_43_15]OGF78823.1 MAG: hypothetical protein A3A15_00350 [Candidatus Giovannonibacteria bacterium RIFCSPLOWO2_01_FULL_43_60]OGF89148.1 MAG: hypothetical protein A3